MRLLLTVIMLTVICAKPCQFVCECNDFPRDPLRNDSIYTSVTCRSVVNITKDVPKTTDTLQFLNLSHEEVSVILNNTVFTEKNFPKLHRVSFIHCNISNLSYNSLNGFRNIKLLDISHTQITYLKIPFAIKNLEVLNLSYNGLRAINDNPFRNLSSLKTLNLSGNLIETLDKTIFTGMTELLSLDLATNKLSTLKSEYFIPLSALQYLNLSNNLLQVLNEACCDSLQRLRHLDVSQNRLARVAPGSLQLPSLSHLVLAGNTALGRSRSPSLLIGLSKRLQNVDVSNTGLKQVPDAITHSIKTLILSKNSIHYVGCGHLDSYPLLKLLDFRSNDLEIIEDDALGRLDLLSILYLSDNKLHSLPRHLPESLKTLFLENNKIESLLRGDFQGMSLLETLILSDNKIKVIQEGAFNELENLSNLDMSRNPISVLRAGALEGPRQLRILRLANLSVISLAKEMEFPLPSPEHLKLLDLSYSPGLGMQFLADTAALVASKELQEIYISCDYLKYIKSEKLNFLPQLRLLQIFNSTFNCSQWMQMQNLSDSRPQSCVISETVLQIRYAVATNDRFSTEYSSTSTAKPSFELKSENVTTVHFKNKTELRQNDKTIWTQNFKQFYSENNTLLHSNKSSQVPSLLRSRQSEVSHKSSDKSYEEESYIIPTVNFTNGTPTAGKIVMISESKGHPGILVLIVVILSASSMLVFTLFRSRRCVSKYHRQNNEVSNVPNATELW